MTSISKPYYLDHPQSEISCKLGTGSQTLQDYGCFLFRCACVSRRAMLKWGYVGTLCMTAMKQKRGRNLLLAETSTRGLISQKTHLCDPQLLAMLRWSH